jgi:hypothetical protein
MQRDPEGSAETTEAGLRGPEALAALERFVIENDDLLAFESRIGRFNIFDALGVARAEIRPSNFLAFLLDPAESHGQGQLFLKAFLMDLLKQAPAEMRPLSPIDLDGTDLRGIEVKREWNHIDILIRCKEPAFVVVVENKIGAKEGPDQLSRYAKVVRKQFPGVLPLCVYLTLDADEPSEDDWVPYSYADVWRVLNRVRDTYHKSIGDEVLVFLDHYLNLIGTRFMNDEKLDELCRKIYKNHRRALDLIWERVGSPTSGVLAEVKTILERDGRWDIDPRPSVILIQPKIWSGWLPPLSIKNDRWWVLVFIREKDGRLDYGVQMTPAKEPGKRLELIKELVKEKPGFEFEMPKSLRKSKEVKNNHCNIFPPQRIIDLDEDGDSESEEIRAAVEKTLNDIHPRLEKLGKFLKSACK